MTNSRNQWLGIFNKKTPLEKAVQWVKNNRIPKSGIKAHHKTKNVTAEVTGYLITSLYNVGEKNLALDLAQWEASFQDPSGGFAAPGTPVLYTFDTAQVMRGFLSVINDRPSIKDHLFRASEFMVGQIDSNGTIGTPDDSVWLLPNGTKLSEYCYLYTIWPLREAGRLLNEKRFIQAAQKALDYYKNQSDLTKFKPELRTLSHIFGYMMEGLAELGEIELAKKGLEEAFKLQKEDGSIVAYPGSSWICSTGIAQLGIASYLVGNKERAAKCLSYLEKIQNKSGGWYGGYGPGTEYFPQEEIPWANKFFIDLYLLVKGSNGAYRKS